MIRIFLFFILFLGVAKYSTAQSKNLFYMLEGFNGDKAILYSINGDYVKPIDTAYRQSTGSYVFFGIDKYKPGVYNIYFSDSLYTEVIINNEDIVINANSKNLLTSINVSKSVENKILFDYWKYAISVKDSILIYEYQIRKIELKTYDSNHPKIKSMEKRIAELNQDIYKYISNQLSAYPNRFAPILLKSYLLPNMQEYNTINTEHKYYNEKAFLKDHYFDNIDFTDERFLRTKVLYTVINEYIQTYGIPASTLTYNNVVDKVMSTAAANDKIYEYCLDLFFRTFESSVFESVMVHLIDDYYLPHYALSGVNTTYYSNLSDRIKALRLGKKAPNIILNDNQGVSHNMYKTKAKAKMIVFYSSDCSHCKDALPGLLEIAEMYKSQGLVTFGLAIDDDEKIWKDEIIEYNMNWISVSDLKGLSSPIVQEYNIQFTPFIFILNEDNVIMKKPIELNDIHSTLVQLLNDI